MSDKQRPNPPGPDLRTESEGRGASVALARDLVEDLQRRLTQIRTIAGPDASQLVDQCEQAVGEILGGIDPDSASKPGDS